MRRIGSLELVSRTVVDGLLAGRHRSNTKGGCSEFAGHRPYSIGDEVRAIDWQVYARNDRYVVRQFDEETNLHAMIAIDASGSMGFGLSTISKLDYAARAAACLARLLLHQRDAVGLAVLHPKAARLVPSGQHAAHLRAILGTLAKLQPSAPDDGLFSLGGPIRQCVARQRRRGLFVLLTDGFGETGDPADLIAALRTVRARGQDVLVLHTLAPEELSFDFRHWSAFTPLEGGPQLAVDPPAVRRRYLEQMQAFVDTIERQVVGLGGDYVRLTTATDLGEALAWVLRSRKMQLARPAVRGAS